MFGFNFYRPEEFNDEKSSMKNVIKIHLRQNGEIAFHSNYEDPFEHKIIGYLVEDMFKTHTKSKYNEFSKMRSSMYSGSIFDRLKAAYKFFDKLPKKELFCITLELPSKDEYHWSDSYTIERGHELGNFKFDNKNIYFEDKKCKDLKEAFFEFSKLISIENADKAKLEYEFFIESKLNSFINYESKAPSEIFTKKECEVNDQLIAEILPKIEKAVKDNENFVVSKNNIFEYKFILQDRFDEDKIATKYNFLKKTIIAKSKEEADKVFEEFKKKVDLEKTPLPDLGRYRKTWNMQTLDEYRERMTKNIKLQIEKLQKDLEQIVRSVDSAEFNEIGKDRIYEKKYSYKYRC